MNNKKTKLLTITAISILLGTFTASAKDMKEMDHSIHKMNMKGMKNMDHSGHDMSMMKNKKNIIRSENEDSMNSIFVCPMHPEQMSETAGSCPICGMNLQKVELSEE